MTHPTDQLDRRSGSDRRRPADDLGAPAPRRPASAVAFLSVMPDPIASWPLSIPPQLREVRCLDPWCHVVHRSIVGEHAGDHDEAARAWDDAIVWRVDAHDPSGRSPDGRGAASVIAYHDALAELTDATYLQELVAIEGSRGPIVQAYLRTTATRGDRALDIPTLLVFELTSLRIRRVTEIPGDVPAWDAFWRE